MVQTQVSMLVETEFDLLHVQDGAFCGNLIYTIKYFSNHFHVDNDYNSYTFGIWASIYLETNKLLSRRNSFQSAKG